MQKIVPHLWFATQAKEAAEFYTRVFPNSSITSLQQIHGTPSGDCDIVSFDVNGFSFMAISAGPHFTINPSISFFVNFDPSRDAQAKENLTALWEQLSEGGKALMPLQEYPFSKWYGWVQDKFGVSWQLILANPEGEERPFIVPSLMFVGDVAGKAEEATEFYLSIFKDSHRGLVARYGAGMEPDKEGTLMYTDFALAGQWFAAMDSAHKHEFAFNEAVSLIVNCENQEEVDYFMEKLSAFPEAEQCGWIKDKYRVSWQIIPKQMNEIMGKAKGEQLARVTAAMLQMKKLDVAGLQRAFDGEYGGYI